MTRLEKIQKAMVEQEMEALLVLDPFNLRYASHFTGTSGLALITPQDGYFVTDSRYIEQAKDQATDYQIVDHQGHVFETLGKLLNPMMVDALGIEEDHVTLSQFYALDAKVDAQLVDSQKIIEDLRQVKEDQEIATIQKAIQITEAAFDHILDFIQVGQTEIEVATELDFFMRQAGASGLSFDTIVASGYRSALPHGVASHKTIENNELVTIDFGCYYQGYVSDMTRTFAIGQVDDQLLEIYDIVKTAHLKVTQAASAQLTGQELDAVARDYISERGYGDAFGHSTGHGIGLDIHEDPAISPRNDQLLPVHTVITNEPGIYLPGLGGVRIENDLLITAEGCQDLMSQPIDLIHL